VHRAKELWRAGNFPLRYHKEQEEHSGKIGVDEIQPESQENDTSQGN